MNEPFYRFRQDPAAPDPCALLGLPDPRAVVLEDPQLASVYAEFCDHLAADPHGRFVRADGCVFWNRWTGGCDDRLAALRLLAALYHPNPTQVEGVRRRLGEFVRYRNRRGEFSGHVYDHEVLRCFEAFRDAGQAAGHAADHATLTAHTCKGRTLGRLRDDHGAGPGFTFSADLHLSRYADRWAIILFFGDAENDPHEAFPCVLGFARMDQLERNAACLLDQEDLFHSPTTFIMHRGVSDLVALGWYGGEEEPCVAPFFCQFSDRQLDAFRRAPGGLLDPDLISMADHLVGELGSPAAEEMVARFGPPTGPEYLDEVVRRLEELEV